MIIEPPTPAWTQFRPHPAGVAYSRSRHRFNVVPAGRRSGKTARAKRKMLMRALSASTPWAPRYFAAAPTRDQAKRIFWDDLKALSPRYALANTSESDLCLTYITGAQIWVIGLDKPQRMEGQPWDGGVVDEIGNAKEKAWSENIRPALSDRLGWCDLIGVPEGRNHYYELYRRAKARYEAEQEKSDWAVFSWPSSDILPAKEIADAKNDLDELSFQQEYEASFINFEGRAYYPFLESTHSTSLRYDPNQPLVFCFDFNVAPGVAAVVQEQILPGQYERDENGVMQLDRPVHGTGIIGEVHIPRNSNTPAVCRKLIQEWGKHPADVRCYGDATGGNKGSAKLDGSDWELIERELRPKFGGRLKMMQQQSNPAERARVNAVNSRLLTSAGTIRMMVDGGKASNVVTDFEGVVLLKGGSGEIDKDETPKLTHLTDAIGYYVEQEFPVSGENTRRIEIGGL